MCTTDTRNQVSIDTGDRPVIDTWSTSQSTLGWPLVDTQSTDFQFLLTFYRVAIDTSDDHTLVSVDVSIATLPSAVGSMLVVCQWCIGSMLVMYSSQYPSSNGGILPNTPSASVRYKFQLFLVIFCVSKISYFEGSHLSEWCPRVQFLIGFDDF